MATGFKRYRFTIEAYERMGETGIIPPDRRTELIEGEIVEMAPIGDAHAGVTNRLLRLFRRFEDLGHLLMVGNPIVLPPRSEPQPDVCLVSWRDDFYASGKPRATDVLLLVEVADATLRTDRTTKAALYARHGIREYWVVDIAARAVHRYAEPAGETYRRQETVRDGELRPIFASQAAVTVDEILGTPSEGRTPVDDVGA